MNDVKTVGARILQYLDAKGITRNQFCKAKGWDPSKINRQLKGETALSAETLEGFVFTYDDVNLFWLLLGEGPMLTTGATQRAETADAPGVMVRADHIAPTPETTDTPAPSPASPPSGLDLSEALKIIKSQQDIIERQAAMLERLVTGTTAPATAQPLNPKQQ